MKDIKVFRLRVRLKNGTSGTVTTETHLILAKDEENAISEFRKWFALNRYSDSSGIRIDDISVEISDNVICPSTACFPTSCEGCENIGLRYPYASMYPCTNCRRANSRDFYKASEDEVMIIDADSRGITLYKYRQAKGDPNYGTCLWADFMVDSINNRLVVFSDAGDYLREWPEDTQPFESLMAKCNKSYLLEKLSKQSVVDEKRTIEALDALLLEEKDISEELFSSLHEIIVDIITSFSSSVGAPELKVQEVARVFESESLSELDESVVADCFHYDYPIGAKTIVDIFVKYIQPKLLG
jgi:hypothetical protein